MCQLELKDAPVKRASQSKPKKSVSQHFEEKAGMHQREQTVSGLSASDEGVLASITSSGGFTPEKVKDRYCGVQRLRNQK
jgi:isoaspartyl peptidase/L-asparaginase-like protein (Ntn-hydrolase superfamily)